MLDTWLKVAYDHSREDKAEADLFATMKQLPIEELHKLAMGMSCGSGSGPDWLDHYKGTPLFEQAIQLEQEDIQLEMARKQQSEQDRSMWDMRDQLGMKKRLLDIQLAQLEQQQLTGQPAVPPGAAAGGAPPGAAPPPEAAPPGPGGGAPPGGPGGGGATAIDPATGTPKSVTVKMGAAMPEQQQGGHPDARSLGLGEALLAMGLGGPPGLFGAQKGMQHSGEGLEGGLRGALGYMGGAPIGAMLGQGAGNIGVGLAGGGPEARALGGAAGRTLGGLGGGIAGYKLLTSKYNEPHRDAAPPRKEEHPEPKEVVAEVQQAVAWARELARADREKIADAVTMLETSVAMGKALAKTGAFDPAALIGHAKGLAGRAVGLAKSNPAAAMGALGGGVGGAVSGAMQTDEHGQHSIGKALGGGLLGAAAGGLGGHAGSNIAQSVSSGTPVGSAVKHYAGHWGEVLRNAVGKGTPAAMTAPLG